MVLYPAEALAWTKAVMTRFGLTLKEVKTSLRNAQRERFDFLRPLTIVKQTVLTKTSQRIAISWSVMKTAICLKYFTPSVLTDNGAQSPFALR